MTTKILIGGYSAGYALHAPTTILIISPTGYVGGSGVTTPVNATFAYTVIDENGVQAVASPTNPTGSGILLTDGGSVTQGGVSDTSSGQGGEVSGGNGVLIQKAAGTVANFGFIDGMTPGTTYAGVYLSAGGRVTNGSAMDTTAMIEGYGAGVQIANAPGTVTNLGLIESQSRSAIQMSDGGAITNGSVLDTYASIAGGTSGVLIEGEAGTVTNLGIIEGSLAPGDYAIRLEAGGVVKNGSLSDTGALIEGGYAGVFVSGGAGSVVNFGTIQGATGLEAVRLSGGGIIVNGSATDTGALIKGWAGVFAYGATLTNFGTIIGMGGSAVAGANIVAEAGSVIKGQISENVAQTIKVVSGTASVSGGIEVRGSITGAGNLALTGGTSDLFTGTKLAVAQITVSGANTFVYAFTSLNYAGKWTQTAGDLDIYDTMTFAGGTNSFSGTVSGAGGTIVLSGGVDALAGATLTVKRATIVNAAVTLSGPISFTGPLAVTDQSLTVAAGGVSLSGGGNLQLSNLATNRIWGATAAATLTNVDDSIGGSGLLGGGQMGLINEAAGTIFANGAVGLTIDTGTNTVANAGTIENLASGGTTISSAVDNTGLLDVTSGTLTVNGTVAGTGAVHIAGGAAKFASAFNQDVVFTGTTGLLALTQAYAGTITGFSTTGKTTLGLDEIAYVSGTTTASYAGSTTGGILTVTSGGEIARIHFAGDYLASVWTLSAGPGGGTTIIDPAGAAPASGPPRLTRSILASAGFAQTMAGIATRTDAAAIPGAEFWRTPSLVLMTPRTQTA